MQRLLYSIYPCTFIHTVPATPPAKLLLIRCGESSATAATVPLLLALTAVVTLAMAAAAAAAEEEPRLMPWGAPLWLCSIAACRPSNVELYVLNSLYRGEIIALPLFPPLPLPLLVVWWRSPLFTGIEIGALPVGVVTGLFNCGGCCCCLLIKCATVTWCAEGWW